MAGDENTQSFSFDTVAVLVAALLQKGVKLGMAEYTRMAELDGKRGAHAFNHQFRKVKQRATELQSDVGSGGVATPKKKTPKKDAGAAGSTGKKRVRESEEEGSAHGDQAEQFDTPCKKVKAEPDMEEDGGYFADALGELEG